MVVASDKVSNGAQPSPHPQDEECVCGEDRQYQPPLAINLDRGNRGSFLLVDEWAALRFLAAPFLYVANHLILRHVLRRICFDEPHLQKLVTHAEVKKWFRLLIAG